MVALIDLPPELLNSIIQKAAPNCNSLASCCLVCHTFNNVATPLLYARVDFCALTLDEDEDEDDYEDNNANEESDVTIKDGERLKIRKRRLTKMQKQKSIISAIAKSPRLGSFVQAFYNNSREENDATKDRLCNPRKLTAAGRNMTSLYRAHLEKSMLGIAIITSLEKYHNLIELSVRGFQPGLFVWAPKLLNLRRLTWTTPLSADDDDEKWSPETGNQWKTLSYFLNVVESTCPLLESLDLNFETSALRYDDPDTENRYRSLAVVPERSILYITRIDKPPLIPRLLLDRLKHFGVRDEFGMVCQSSYRDLMQAFLCRYEKSLTSLTLPISNNRTESEIDFILSMTECMPELQEIALVQLEFSGWSPAATAMESLCLLTTRLSPPGNAIKYFTMSDVGTHFSPEMAILFQPWTRLKYLRLGDRDNSRGLYNNDGRLDLEGYNLATFIKKLPLSLEELVLVINGHEIMLEDDSDEFSELCDQGPSIFKTLKRLRSCDIIFWISNLDGGLGSIPEKAIHWKRAGYIDPQTRKISNKTKILCLSAMEHIYQEEVPAIARSYVLIGLDDGDGTFEGEDAEDSWWHISPIIDQGVPKNEWIKQLEEDMVDPRIEDLHYYPLYNRYHHINPYRPTL